MSGSRFSKKFSIFSEVSLSGKMPYKKFSKSASGLDCSSFIF